MKAEEFRIGNYFMSNVIQQIGIEHLEFLLNDSIKDKSAMKPIKLTEEWLKKVGFTKLPLKKYDNGYQGRADLNFGYPILYLNQHTYLTMNCSIPNGYIFIGKHRVECKYVHQLQNLFFALTGTELVQKSAE